MSDIPAALSRLADLHEQSLRDAKRIEKLERDFAEIKRIILLLTKAKLDASKKPQ